MRIIIAALVLSLAGCTVGPNYCRPNLGCPQPFEDVQSDGLAVGTGDVDLTWWESFDDETLNWLVAEAVRNNNDVARAACRILEVKALKQLACSLYAPLITPTFSANRNHESGNQTFGGIIQADTILTFNQWDFQVGASWEIDLWGRIRREVEAANADLSAAIFDRREVILSLLGEVAVTYMELRGFQKALKVAHQNIEVQTDGVEVTTARFEAGLTSMLDVTQQRSLLASTEAILPNIETDLQESISRLSVLLGRCPGDLVAMLSPPVDIPTLPPAIALGEPCDLVCRRPDVRRAERELAAATARIGVAVAEYFPRFSLGQIVGLATQDYKTLFSSGSILWQAGMSLIGPIIQGTRLKSNVELERARMCQACFNYRQSVLNAYEDVRNSLIAYGNEKVRYVHVAEALENSRASLELSTELYRNGLITFLDVLVAQASVNDLDLELVQSEAQLVVNAVSLYKSLGGGWETVECLGPRS